MADDRQTAPHLYRCGAVFVVEAVVSLILKI